MDVLGTAVNTVVVAAIGGVLAWLAKGRFDALDHRIDRLEARIDGRVDTLQGSVDALRSDLTQVALAVGVGPRVENG